MRALLLVALISLPALAQRSEEEAGDVSEVDKDRTGPLRDRITPVSGHLFLMKGRFEISPEVGISFKDAFYTKYAPGLMMSFHFTETLGVSLRGAYAISVVSGAAQICTTDAMGTKTCVTPTLDTLDAGAGGTLPFGRMGLLVDLNIEWAPIYGKLATLAAIPFIDTIHFNMYIAAGGAAVMFGQRNQLTGGGNVQIGFRFFITRFMTLRAELRDVIYYDSVNTPGSVRNQLMLDLGLSFFLPLDFQRE